MIYGIIGKKFSSFARRRVGGITMVITDLELAQASMELVGGFVSAMLAVIIIINRHEETSMGLIVKMLFLSSALFVFDAFAYLFRGNTDLLSLFMTRLSNLAVFFLNFLLAYVANGYIYSILQERQATPGKIYRQIVRFGFWAAVAILAINLFTGWMYSFDATNHYHRNWGWYVYTGLSLVCLSASCTLVIQYRRALDRLTMFSLLFFELFPLAAIVLQSMFYGISITNIGIAASIVLVLVAYLVNWNRSGISERANTEQIRRSYDTTVLFIIMVISVSASIMSCIVSLRQISAEISVSSSQVIARVVCDRIENLFLRPITVTETMSKDYSLQKYMNQSNQQGSQSAEAEMAAYLESIRSGFDYQMVYAVCDQSRAYYTYNGFVKTIDPEHNQADAWYRDFLATGQSYALQADTDQANNWDLSMFINTAVRDEDGQLLGVCGVGLEMAELQRQLSEFEDKYDIRITLEDRVGRAIITSKSAQIGENLHAAHSPEEESGKEFTLREQDGIMTMTKLMEDCDWYLIVEDLSPERVSIAKVVVPNVAIFLAGLFMLAVAFCVITIRERKIASELLEKRRTSLCDELTGLGNRRALQQDCKELEEDGRLHQLTVILMDLNGLKATNDTLGHQAGDELIIGTARCLSLALGEHGQLYRTGGDEFVALLHCTGQELERSLKEFDQLTAAWHGTQTGPISTARGVVNCADFPHLNFAALMDMADRQMYEDKKQYYLRTGKKQRQ